MVVGKNGIDVEYFAANGRMHGEVPPQEKKNERVDRAGLFSTR